MEQIKTYLKKSKIIRRLGIQLRITRDYFFDTKDTPLYRKEPWIVKGAIDWLSTYLNRDMVVFEWGSGGSTLFTAKRVKKIISIEHNYEWFLKTQIHLWLSGISNCQYKLIEPEDDTLNNVFTLKYKSSSERHQHQNFEKYCKAIDSFPDNYFDLIFIDGRARDLCIEHAKNKIKPGGYLLLDNSERERYQSAINKLSDFKRTDFVSLGSTTSIFQKK